MAKEGRETLADLHFAGRRLGAAAFGPDPPTELMAFFGRLPARSSLRRLAEEQAKSPGPVYSLTLYRDALARTEVEAWREQVAAAWVLGRARLTDAQRPEALALLSAVAENGPVRRAERRADVAGRAGNTAWVVSMALCVPLLFLVVTDFGQHPLGAILFSIVVGFILSVGVAPLAFPLFFAAGLTKAAVSAGKARETAALAMGELRDPTGVAVLAGVAREGDGNMRLAARDALLRTLPELTEGYVRLHPDFAVPTLPLCRLLPVAEPALQVAALHALERVGSGAAVDAVRRLAGRDPDPGVRAEAARVLPTLEARRAAEAASATLVRTSEAPAGELLRPASANDTAPAELLRAAE